MGKLLFSARVARLLLMLICASPMLVTAGDCTTVIDAKVSNHHVSQRYSMEICKGVSSYVRVTIPGGRKADTTLDRMLESIIYSNVNSLLYIRDRYEFPDDCSEILYLSLTLKNGDKENACFCTLDEGMSHPYMQFLGLIASFYPSESL